MISGIRTHFLHQMWPSLTSWSLYVLSHHWSEPSYSSYSRISSIVLLFQDTEYISLLYSPLTFHHVPHLVWYKYYCQLNVQIMKMVTLY